MSNEFLKSQIEKSILDLKEEVLNINDGQKCLSDISASTMKIITDAINTANETESIDDRIQALVKGMQSLMQYIEKYSAQLSKSIFERNIRVETLQNILDQQPPPEKKTEPLEE